ASILTHITPSTPSSTFPVYFTATPTTDLYTLSLHDALPISNGNRTSIQMPSGATHMLGYDAMNREASYTPPGSAPFAFMCVAPRSEEHTSELQSLTNLVCRLLLEKKKKIKENIARHSNPPPT